MFLDSTQGWRVVQVFCGSQDHIRVILKNAQRRITSFTQDPTNIIRVVAVVYRKFVLFELEGAVTDSTIIPLKFQQEVII
jgi:hypothetical protein